MHYGPPPTINDAINALKPLARIPRPDFVDNDTSDAINSDLVLSRLDIQHQDLVHHALPLLLAYTRDAGGEPNKKSINSLIRHHYPTNLNQAQYGDGELAGEVRIQSEIDPDDYWILDISDQTNF